MTFEVMHATGCDYPTLRSSRHLSTGLESEGIQDIYIRCHPLIYILFFTLYLIL